MQEQHHRHQQPHDLTRVIQHKKIGPIILAVMFRPQLLHLAVYGKPTMERALGHRRRHALLTVHLHALHRKGL